MRQPSMLFSLAKVSVIMLVMGLTSCSPAVTTTLPTATPTISPTNTPLPTNTPAPTNTPLPPSGNIMIVINDEVRVYPADEDGDGNFLIPQETFRSAFPAVGEHTPVIYPYLSPDGKKIAVVTCTQFMYTCQNHRLYISTIDLKTNIEFTNYSGGLLAWSPTSDNVLIQGDENPSDKLVISARPEDFGTMSKLPPADAAFWKYDGNQVYYYKDGWHIINSDGTNKQDIPCDLCALAPSPTSFAVSQSPDGKHIAIGYMDGSVFIVNSSNFADLKMGSVGSYVSRLFWSPDSTKLAVNVEPTTSQLNIVIMSMEGILIEEMAQPEGVNFSILCGWSPDSQHVDYLSMGENNFSLFLHKLGEQASIQRIFIESVNQNCPIWLE